MYVSVCEREEIVKECPLTYKKAFYVSNVSLTRTNYSWVEISSTLCRSGFSHNVVMSWHWKKYSRAPCLLQRCSKERRRGACGTFGVDDMRHFDFTWWCLRSPPSRWLLRLYNTFGQGTLIVPCCDVALFFFSGGCSDWGFGHSVGVTEEEWLEGLICKFLYISEGTLCYKVWKTIHILCVSLYLWGSLHSLQQGTFFWIYPIKQGAVANLHLRACTITHALKLPKIIIIVKY